MMRFQAVACHPQSGQGFADQHTGINENDLLKQRKPQAFSFPCRVMNQCRHKPTHFLNCRTIAVHEQRYSSLCIECIEVLRSLNQVEISLLIVTDDGTWISK